MHVPVLMYHSVSRGATPEFSPYAIDPALFREHMSLLAELDYDVVTVSQYVDEIRELVLDDSSRVAVLTFDDAFTDFHDTALPILAEFDFPATLYVPTAYVGLTSGWLEHEGEADRPIMSWNALAEAVDAGVEVGSHSRSHADLDLVDRQQLRAEVVDSRWELEDQLQTLVSSFAYPFGHSNAAVRAAVADAGYSSGVAVRDLASGHESPFRISRWTVRGDMPTDELAELLQRRNSPLATVRSDAHAMVSTLLRRTGLKRRPAMDTHLRPSGA